MNQELLVSVVVCAQRPLATLHPCLRSLTEQSYHTWEIVLVMPQNRRTTDVFARFPDSRERIKIIQADVGNSEARNLGAGAALGDIIAFIDDDAIATPEWLANIVGPLMEGWHVVGGPIRPIYLARPPRWWDETDFGQYVAVNNVRSKEIWSCNLAITRRALVDTGGFDPRLGRARGTLLSNEDIEFVNRASSKGYPSKFVYEAEVFHLIPASRLSLSFLMRRAFWQGISGTRMRWIMGFPLVRIYLGAGKEIFRSLVSFYVAPSTVHRINSVLRLLMQVGELAGFFGLPEGDTV